MAIAVEMPKMSDTMDEGVLVAWLAEEGQKVAAGDVIAQVETDKATMDLEVYDDGILLKCVAAEGDAVPIGGLIAVLGKEGEDISAILEGGSAEPVQAPVADARQTDTDSPAVAAPVATPVATPVAASATVPVAAPTTASTGPIQVSTTPSGRIKSSPLARKLAADRGIDLSSVVGTGPEGRIIKRDIEAVLGGTALPLPIAALGSVTPSVQTPVVAPALAAARQPSAVPAAAPRVSTAPQTRGGYEVVRISQMRKAIARRLAESKFSSPHFYLTIDLDMDRAVGARTQINALTAAAGKAKISYNDLVTKASALALREHRWVNASFMEAEGEVRLHNDVHVAVAVAIDDGLITPVIRHADRKGLAEIASETRALAERARNKQLQPEEFSDSTFTTSNLGMFGIEEFTAIINPPNACILAIGAIRDEVVLKDGEVVPGKRMKVTLSCDHRVVDGASGSLFLATLRQYLEDPLAMLL